MGRPQTTSDLQPLYFYLIITTLFHHSLATLVVFMSTHIPSPSGYVQDIKDIPTLLLDQSLTLEKHIVSVER